MLDHWQLLGGQWATEELGPAIGVGNPKETGLDSIMIYAFVIHTD